MYSFPKVHKVSSICLWLTFFWTLGTFFLKKIRSTFISPFCGATETAVFWTFSEACPGFPFAYFLACVILRFTSGATPAECIEACMAAELFQSTHLQTCPQALVEIRTGARTYYCVASTGLRTSHPGYVFTYSFANFHDLKAVINLQSHSSEHHSTGGFELCWTLIAFLSNMFYLKKK